LARQESKYHSKRIKTPAGTFDSKREYKRYLALVKREKEGSISNLKRQVKYVLIPAQREPDTIGKRGGKIRGKLIERECYYMADFVYYDEIKGCEVVEDCKGYKTPEYKIKKKLMLYLCGIRLEET